MLLCASVIVVAFIACVLASVLLRKISVSSGLLFSKGMPVIGGISIWGSFCAASYWGIVVCKAPVLSYGAIALTSLAMLVFGIIDDNKELSIVVKFLTQILSAALLMYFGVRTHIVYIGPLLNALITLIWVVGITNAFNHLDISDGVAGVTGILASCAFLVISVLNHDKSSLVVFLALCGALLGFLVLNFPPAKIYMGNAGSHFLGFVFAAAAIAISYAPIERKVALMSPIIILGFPILDTAFLILARIGKRKAPFQKSNDHIILRLKVLGYSPRKILFIMGIWSLFFAGAGVAVSQFPNQWGLLTVGLAGIVSLKIIRTISRVPIND